MNIDTAITMVKEHIEGKLGGNVAITKNSQMRMVIFEWRKNENTIFAERFSHAYSDEELETVFNPNILGHSFVEAYARSKESQEESTENVVEEAVDLPIEKNTGYIAGVDDISQDQPPEENK